MTEQEIKANQKKTLESVFDGALKFCVDVNGDTFEQSM